MKITLRIMCFAIIGIIATTVLVEGQKTNEELEAEESRLRELLQKNLNDRLKQKAAVQPRILSQENDMLIAADDVQFITSSANMSISKIVDSITKSADAITDSQLQLININNTVNVQLTKRLQQAENQLVSDLKMFNSSLSKAIRDEVQNLKAELEKDINELSSSIQGTINAMKACGKINMVTQPDGTCAYAKQTSCDAPVSKSKTTTTIVNPHNLAAEMLPGAFIDSVTCKPQTYINSKTHKAAIAGGSWSNGTFSLAKKSICRKDGTWKPSVTLPVCESMDARGPLKDCKYAAPQTADGPMGCDECLNSKSFLSAKGKCCSDRFKTCCPSGQFMDDDGNCEKMPTSCKAVNDLRLPSGVYNIIINNRNVPVYCNNDRNGGGWTLMALIPTGGNSDNNVGPSQWRYNNARWTNENGAGAPPQSKAELASGTNSKNQQIDYMSYAYGHMPYSEMMVALDKWDNDRRVVLDIGNEPRPSNVFRGRKGDNYNTGPTSSRDWWTRWADNVDKVNHNCWNNQGYKGGGHCDVKGFNMVSNTQRCHFGTTGNNENECNSNDSAIGFGCQFVSAGFDTWAACQSVSTKGYIYIR